MKATHVTLALLLSVLAIGCKGAKQQPDADAAAPRAPAPEPADKSASAVDTPAPSPSAKAAASETGEPEQAATTGEAPSETGEPEPPPAFVELPTDPAADPMRALLGGDQPETVEIFATHEHGRRRLLVYRLDLGARWHASRPDDDALVEQLDAARAACEEIGNIASMYECINQVPALPGVPPELVLHLAHGDAYAWEIAEVELDRAGRARVLARKRLLDFGLAAGTDIVETKLKVYDMDGDKRSEILLVFPLALPTTDDLDSTDAAAGFVLDRADLHIQFATTRSYLWEWSDVSSISTFVETTWQARDENGDGYEDLVVRERTQESRDDSEWGEDSNTPSKDTRTTRSTVCLYELAGDRWVCPDWLGTKLIDGSKLVEQTSVPVVVEPPAEAEPASG